MQKVIQFALSPNAWQLGEVQEFERQMLNSDSGTNCLYFAKLLVICRPSFYVVKNSFRNLE